MIVVVILYLVVSVVVFRILEINKIGFWEYWYEAPEESLSSLYNDKSLIGACSAILISLTWPLCVPVMIIYMATGNIAKSYSEGKNDERS